MVGYRIVNTLCTADAAYIAGLIDGEGTITLTRKHRNENHQLALTISNTDHSLLQYVLQTVGAVKITSKRTTWRHHTPSHTYALYNRQALTLFPICERTRPDVLPSFSKTMFVSPNGMANIRRNNAGREKNLSDE